MISGDPTRYATFDSVRNLVVGSVDFVSPGEIRVVLDQEAPHNIALNPGSPTVFPRINSYVLIPHEAGALVGVISYLSTEVAPYPKGASKDLSLLNLPFPSRRLALVPVGTLIEELSASNKPVYKLERGVYSFPSVGDSVALPLPSQLEAIIANKEGNPTVKIGCAPMAADTAIKVDPNRIFGRHLAVLGNTGSGKSCSVAGLVRWCIEAANESPSTGTRHGRFIILDPNGEYAQAFADYQQENQQGVKLRLLSASPKPGAAEEQFTVPAWLWNHREWSAFTSAAPGTQRPVLIQALSVARSEAAASNSQSTQWLRMLYNSTKALNDKWQVESETWKINQETASWFVKVKTCTEKLLALTNTSAPTFEQSTKLNDLWAINETFYQRYSKQDKAPDSLHFESYNQVVPALRAVIKAYPDFKRVEELEQLVTDSPLPFEINDLPGIIERLAARDNSRDLHALVDTLNLRLRTLLGDEVLNQCVKSPSISLTEWLTQALPTDELAVTIIDLSLLSSNYTHFIVAVFARLIFEAQQRWQLERNAAVLPTTLVIEEAHVFIRDSRNDEAFPFASLCRETFERIAREGRKFGLGLLLSSQRPSELSSTVLSQCNTFLLHRIVNDQDQELVRRLVPDHIGSLLRELPMLPTRKAVLLGWASPIPILIEMRKLEKAHRPHSQDSEFWKAWTGQKPNSTDWQPVVDSWQKRHLESNSDENHAGSDVDAALPSNEPKPNDKTPS